MTFDEVLDQVRELLQQRGRLTYGAVSARLVHRRFDTQDLKDTKALLEELA